MVNCERYSGAPILSLVPVRLIEVGNSLGYVSSVYLHKAPKKEGLSLHLKEADWCMLFALDT